MISDHERSQARWKATEPNEDLTWGRWVSGQAFIEKVSGLFGPEQSVLEIGPGYGRLFQAVLDLELPFQKYTGVDLSEHNVAALEEKFPQAEFVHADIETVELEPVDLAISSLVFKHLYPDFRKALKNIPLKDGGRIVFDLVEGKRAIFPEADAYLRDYSREEVEQIAAEAGLTVSFGEVTHEPGWSRLLVTCA